MDSQFLVSFQHNANYSIILAPNESTISESNSKESQDNPKQNFSLLFTFCVISLLIVLINLRVFQIVTTEPRQKYRSINFFVAHFSFLAIGFACVVLIYVMEKSNVLSLTAPGLCEMLSLFRNILLSLFPLNSVAITYVQTRCSTSNLSNTFLFLGLVLIWAVASVGSLPSIFMVKYTKDSRSNLEKCKQIPLLGTFKATLVYEVFRFIVYHLLVCSYMAYAMIKIRSRIRYLYIRKPIPRRMKRRVQRIRFVYLHSIIFILIWLPTGLGLGIYKLRTRIDWMADYITLYTTTIVVLCSSLFILSPLIYVFLHEGTSTVIFKGIGMCGSSCTKNEVEYNVDTNVHEIPRKNKANIPAKCEGNRNSKCNRRIKGNPLHELTNDMSRVSTVVMSESSDKLHFSNKNGIVRSFSYRLCFQDLTSLKKSQTYVQTYVDVRGPNFDARKEPYENIDRETLV